MQGIQIARVEEVTRNAYPSTAAFRVGIFHILIGLGWIGCAIASQSIELDFDRLKTPFLYGGLAMGVSALLVGIIAVVSGKSKTGCCLLLFLLIFTIIAMLIAGGLAVYSGIIFQSLQERKKDFINSAVNSALDYVAPNNPISGDIIVVNIICNFFLVLSCLETILALMSTCFICKGICCTSDPPYTRILYPAQPQLISTGNVFLASPPSYVFAQ